MFLCYNTPANMSYFGWENEALPLGNGHMGAKVFGNPVCELISMNEKSLWSGGKDVKGFHGGVKNADGGKAVKEVQDLLFEGRHSAATAAMQHLQGDEVGLGAYQAFGSLYLQFEDMNGIDHYVRDLDLDSASAMVTYRREKVSFTRHYFISYPDRVFVGRLEAAYKNPEEEETAPPPTFSFEAYFVSEQNGEPVAQDDMILLEGKVQANRGILRLQTELQIYQGTDQSRQGGLYLCRSENRRFHRAVPGYHVVYQGSGA